MKYSTKSTIISTTGRLPSAVNSCAISAISAEAPAAAIACMSVSAIIGIPVINEPPTSSTARSRPQMSIWKIPTKPIPIILPSSKSTGFTLETISSTMRLVFSSITPCITIEPYESTNI